MEFMWCFECEQLIECNKGVQAYIKCKDHQKSAPELKETKK